MLIPLPGFAVPLVEVEWSLSSPLRRVAEESDQAFAFNTDSRGMATDHGWPWRMRRGPPDRRRGKNVRGVDHHGRRGQRRREEHMAAPLPTKATTGLPIREISFPPSGIARRLGGLFYRG